MRATIFAVSAASLFVCMTVSANAQMCGPGQQAQASGQQQSSAMMCGMMGRQAVDDPMADKPEQKSQQQTGMCACCKNMAMMGGQSGQHHQMPGMKQ